MLSSQRYCRKHRINSKGEIASLTRRKNTQGGFTLIELMIVVVVIGILAAIALPNYSNFVRSGHRADAQADMLQFAQAMERCFTRYRTYSNVATDVACSPAIPQAARYTFTVVPNPLTTTTATTFTISATPNTVGGQNLDQCGVMTLDHRGQRTPGTPARCWN